MVEDLPLAAMLAVEIVTPAVALAVLVVELDGGAAGGAELVVVGLT